jgi:putative tricarboxylic transport membrane protein
MSHSMKLASVLAGGLALVAADAAQAAWKPTKSIEFVATAGPGGGTDNLARTIQSIITKHKLIDQSVIVSNKGGGSGAEGYVYGKSQAGDPHKVIFGTSNAWTQPLVSKVAYKHTDLTPIAALAADEFLLWVKMDSPYKTAAEWVAAAKKGDFKMGGAQSKDTDETLTRLIEKAAQVKLTYVPFKSGAETAVQLAGGHLDAHVNNPSESIGQWRGGTQRPLCVFNTKRLPPGEKITKTESWSDIPTCVEQGLNVPLFSQPRTVWLPGGVKPDQAAFYVDLMKKVQAQPEWKEYVERTSQNAIYLVGDEFKKFIAEDLERTKKVAADEGWLVAE